MLKEITAQVFIDKLRVGINLNPLYGNFYKGMVLKAIVENSNDHIKMVYMRKFLYLECNPAKYKSYHNLEPLTGEHLINCLNELKQAIPTSLNGLPVKIFRLHLAMNLNLEEQPKHYISMLQGINPRNGFKPIVYNGNKSIYFNRLKRKQKDTSKNIAIKFYDKLSELKKNGIDISNIILRSGECLDLRKLNLVKVEIAWNKNNLIKSNLGLSDFKSLYRSDLQEFLTEKFKQFFIKNLFYTNPNILSDSGQRNLVINSIIQNLPNPIDICKFEKIMIEAGYKKQNLNNQLLKINQLINSDNALYDEIYQKLLL